MDTATAARRFVGAAAAAALAFGLATAPPSIAASTDQDAFDPANILSDTVLYDFGTMNAAQIQEFLNAKGSKCAPATEPCLKDYRATTVAKSAEASLCDGYAGGLTQTAAQIIQGVAQSCGINPRVLLVTLQKEQGLVTDPSPSSRKYQIAMGYGCPDTAPCDAQYYGFFNQTYLFARQMKRYAAFPTNYGYRAGRVNYIQYHPNTACGTSAVTIANQATASLYNYTPYQPNAAALANLYGTGDACSSYGNRNFWRFFREWFGSTQNGGFLLRTEANATVYLVAKGVKYPISSLSTFNAMSVLGPVGYVSQAYLDKRPTGRAMPRVFLAPNGTVYYFDAGIKLWMGSCDQVADFAYQCGDAVPLEDAQVAAFTYGGPMRNVYRTTTGKAFWVTGGARREVLDDASLAAAGVGSASVTLLESGVGHLPYGAPVVRDGVVVAARTGGSLALIDGGRALATSAALRDGTVLGRLPRGVLDQASLTRLPAGPAMGPFVRAPGSSTVWLLTDRGRSPLTDPVTLPASLAEISATTAGLLPEGLALPGLAFHKATGSGTVYALIGGQRRPIGGWGDLVALNGGTAPAIAVFSDAAVGAIALGPLAVGPGALMRTPENASVYLVDGVTNVIPVASFAVTSELGLAGVRYVSGSTLAAYRKAASNLTTAWSCQPGSLAVGLGGRLHQSASDVAVHFGSLPVTSVAPLTCGVAPKAAVPLSRFLRVANGTIYYVEQGAKRPIRSYGTYLALGGSPANTLQVSDFAAGLLPTGALI